MLFGRHRETTIGAVLSCRVHTAPRKAIGSRFNRPGQLLLVLQMPPAVGRVSAGSFDDEDDTQRFPDQD